MQHYQCNNFGSCQKADDKAVIELATGSEAKCEECGSTLSAVQVADDGAASNGKRWFLLAAAGVVILGGGALGYVMLGSQKAPSVASAAPVSKPAPKVETLQPSGAKLSRLTYTAEETKARQDCAGKAQEQGQADSAQQCLDAAKAQIAVNEAVMALQGGKLELARSRLDEALKFNPKDSLAHYNMAVLAARQSLPEQAAQSLQAAVDNGFKQIFQAEKDPDLAPVRQHPAVRTVLNNALNGQSATGKP